MVSSAGIQFAVTCSRAARLNPSRPGPGVPGRAGCSKKGRKRNHRVEGRRGHTGGEEEEDEYCHQPRRTAQPHGPRGLAAGMLVCDMCSFHRWTQPISRNTCQDQEWIAVRTTLLPRGGGNTPLIISWLQVYTDPRKKIQGAKMEAKENEGETIPPADVLSHPSA